MTALPQELIAKGQYNKQVPVIIGSDRDEAACALASLPRNLSKHEFEGFVGSFGLAHKEVLNVPKIAELFDPSKYPYPQDLGKYSVWWGAAMRVATDRFNAYIRPGQPGMSTGHCSVRCIARML